MFIEVKKSVQESPDEEHFSIFEIVSIERFSVPFSTSEIYRTIRDGKITGNY